MKDFCTSPTRRGAPWWVCALCAGTLSVAHAAQDLAREQAWAHQLEKEVPAAQRVRLGAPPNQSLALFIPPSQTPVGAVIVLHDADGHPDQGAVVAPLRRALPAKGWGTLAIQLPLADSDAKPVDYPALLPTAVARLQAAVEFLHTQKISVIVLAGYGYGAWAAVNFLATQPKSRDDIAGLILISLPGWSGLNPALDTTTLVAGLNLPCLDIVAQSDIADVSRNVDARVTAVRRARTAPTLQRQIPSFSLHSVKTEALAQRRYGIGGYRQRVIAGADHFYAEFNPDLIKSVAGWLHAYWRAIPRDNLSKQESAAATPSSGGP